MKYLAPSEHHLNTAQLKTRKETEMAATEDKKAIFTTVKDSFFDDPFFKVSQVNML